MSASILVLQFQDDRSDKIWAIDSSRNSDGGHDVWYGRRGSRLRYSPIADSQWRKRMNEKFRKGYTQAEGCTIDPSSCRVVASNEDADAIPTSVWYRISAQVSDQQMRDWLETTIGTFAEQFCTEAENLKKLSVFQSIYDGKHTGGAELSDGPLALLLLFALRRHFQDAVSTDKSGGVVQLADDHNQILTTRFDELVELFESGSDFQELKNGFSVADFRKYAVALGACEVPVDLNAISSETKAAFF